MRITTIILKFITTLLALSQSYYCAAATTHDYINISAINYPPITSGNLLPGLGYGLGCDIVTDAFNAVEQKVHFDIIPMSRSTWTIAVKRNRATLGVSNWFSQEEHDTLIDPVDILDMRFVLFYKKAQFPNGLSYTDLSELKNYVIGNVRGSVTTNLLASAGLEVSYVTQIVQAFRMLNAGRVQLVVAVDLSGWQIIHDYYPEQVNEFAAVRQTLMTQPLSLIFRKEDQAAKAQFIRGLQQIISNGIFQETVRAYTEYTGQSPQDNELIQHYIPK